MNTLIELYDERAIENVLAPDMFRPKRVVYLCPAEAVADPRTRRVLEGFFHRRGWDPELMLLECSMFDANRVLKQMLAIAEWDTACAVDVTGGTDAALVAAGLFASQKQDVAVLTYSRKRNRFFNIRNAAFADDVECSLTYTVEDCFVMAGGSMKPGRVDNAVLSRYMDLYEPFFDVFMRYRREWTDLVGWFQRVSQSNGEEEPALTVEAPWTVKGERGGTRSAHAGMLRALESAGMLKDLELTEGERAAFEFGDGWTRTWLRDVGSVLELFVYKACVDSGLFNDVVSSAVVRWDETEGAAAVSNEIDVMAVRGVTPVFISCKTCEIKTEALNELAILRHRFGGKNSKAIIVTAEPCGAAARHRAAQLHIAVIDIEELEMPLLIRRLRTIMKADKE